MPTSRFQDTDWLRVHFIESYRSAGGSVQMEMTEGAGHGPHFGRAMD